MADVTRADSSRRSSAPRCQERGCEARPATGCHYVDGAGHLCVTAWCPQHRAHVGVIPYCRRHALIVSAFESGQLAGPLPGLDNRCASLVAYVGEALEMPLDRLLSGVAQARGERLVTSPIEMVSDAGVHWQRSWALQGGGGESVRVSLSVAESTDPEMVLAVNDRSIAFVVPWIDRRTDGSVLSADEDAAERRQFFAELLEHIGKDVQAALAEG